MVDPEKPILPAAPAIVFNSAVGTDKWMSGEIAAENHPLTEGLNWSGLMCRDSAALKAEAGDRTLVWQGERPLIFLRPAGTASLLVLNFDLSTSNATRLPAFVLLLHRFAEEVRAAKVFPETGNYECHQALVVAADPRLPAPAIPGAEPGPLRAPDRPGFFTVKQGDFVLLQGAAQFADVREADFHERGHERPSARSRAQADRAQQPRGFLHAGVAARAGRGHGRELDVEIHMKMRENNSGGACAPRQNTSGAGRIS